MGDDISQKNEDDDGWIDQLGGLFKSAIQIASAVKNFQIHYANTKRLTGDQLKDLPKDTLRLMHDCGEYIADLRQVAGLTKMELANALQLSDESLLDALEAGSATISFELILRLASLIARHDPIPFVIKLTRTYNPEIWQTLEDWGIGRLPANFERERRFINILRRHDIIRTLDEVEFDELLVFTEAAFEMALNFMTVKKKEEESAQVVESETSKADITNED